MHYVVSNIIIPLTEAKQLSYAELAGPTTLQWFVSHCWGTPFPHFVGCIDKFARAESTAEHYNELESKCGVAAFWICSFSQNQHLLAEEIPGQWQTSSFYKALRSKHCK